MAEVRGSRARPGGQHLHDVEVVQVRARAHVDRLVGAFFVDRGHLPDHDARRVERVIGARDRPRGDHVFAAIDLEVGGQVLQQQIVGVPHLGLHDPCCVARADPRRDADRAVGDEVDLGAVGGDLDDLADESFTVDHRVVDSYPGRGAFVDRHRRIPDVRSFADDGRGDGVVVVDPQLIKVIDRDQLFVGAFFGLIGDEFTAQPVGLLAQGIALAFGVQRVAEPPEQVAHGLQRLVGAVLDRRDDGQECALDAVQTTARSLTEVGRQEQQGKHDEQHQNSSSTPDRLVVHRSLPSEAFT